MPRVAIDAIAAFAGHVTATRFEDLPSDAVSAAKAAILDTLVVGVGGSAEVRARELVELSTRWGSGAEARVWGNGQRLPAAAAALCNAYQVHNAEFDCVHEEAVVHAMSVVLPVALAGAERRTGVSGTRLITAVVVGVDLAAGLGVAATTTLRFFRPATAGAFGATAALGKLIGLDRPGLVNAFSLAYGQACGTMQAHAEGSALLAMQMGFNARNAVVAVDLAAQGFAGPKNVLEGAFGYFKLFESAGSPATVARQLGRRWFVAELAHKPFPSGRATHGIIEACLGLRRRHAISADAIDRVAIRVPPLVARLVGRQSHAEMDANYARLSAPYVAAHALLTGEVGREAFTPQAYCHSPTQELARRILIEAVDAGDPNALTPIEVAIDRNDGARLTTRLAIVCGNPAKPLPRHERLEKVHRNCAAGLFPVPHGTVERLIARIDRLEDVADVGELVDLVCP
jgi:2-methylcitrate dehydratase PrpD